MKSNFPTKFWQQIDALEPSSNVAVITFVGSLCPVTRAHVLCIDEARKLVLGESSSFVYPTSRPVIQKPHLAVAVISLNSDIYVQSKLRRKGELAISVDQRRLLVDLATEEFDWVCCHHNAWRAVQELRKCFPHLCFCQYELDGADVALKNQVWITCSDDHRRIVMGRACESGGVDHTGMIIGMIQQGIISSPNFMLGPMLPDISSSGVRAAFRSRDLDSLREMLPPRVLEWMLSNSPYSADGMVEK